MLKIINLKKNNQLSLDTFYFWKDVIQTIAARHFNNVPPGDVEQMLRNAQVHQGTSYVIFHNEKACGFGNTFYRSVTFGRKIKPYLILDVCCMDNDVRGQHIFGMLSLREILRHKFSSRETLFRKTYALVICLTPLAYLTETMLPVRWSLMNPLSPKQRAIYDAILTSYCHEFKINYAGFEKPIHCETWIPFSTSDIKNKEDVRVQQFLKFNPDWKAGNGLGIIFPMGFRNFISLFLVLIFYQMKNLFYFLRKKHE
ncbi:MAG: hypothetical protein A3B71_05910 [Gammaproteobacteria bacterium RIFCSPHIGHO2_02_FULL_42_43]|nr:MAG: hypothetical protein A3B71_05910 [Gammaproteobacteria bacterium RIFCSPHIGHO2_02_FULL_42_43]